MTSHFPFFISFVFLGIVHISCYGKIVSTGIPIFQAMLWHWRSLLSHW